MKDAICKLTEARNGLRASARAHGEQGNYLMRDYLFERAQLIDDAIAVIQEKLRVLSTAMTEDNNDDLHNRLRDTEDYSQSRAALRRAIEVVTA